MRSVLGGLTVSLSHLELFLLVKTFPNLEQGLGQYGAFWLYAGKYQPSIFYWSHYVHNLHTKAYKELNNKFNFMIILMR